MEVRGHGQHHGEFDDERNDDGFCNAQRETDRARHDAVGLAQDEQALCASSGRRRSLRAVQKATPGTMARWNPETTSIWKEPVRSNPSRNERLRNVRSPVTMAASIAASSAEMRSAAGRRAVMPGRSMRRS